MVQSGFDRLPPVRRDEAYRMNSSGWDQQMTNVERLSRPWDDALGRLRAHVEGRRAAVPEAREGAPI